MELKYLTDLIKKANKAMGKEDKDSGAKLSTKQRKKLKDSSFCGPGRSFPVNDCAHYTAALRLLNRSKYSDATKAKIRACVNRKGKAMGCGGAKKAKSYVEQELGLNIEDIINSEIFESTRTMVEDSIKNPGMDLYPPDCNCEGDCTCDTPCGCDK